MKSLKDRRWQLTARTRWLLLGFTALAVMACMIPLYISRAATPSAGTLDPANSANSVAWSGDRAGGTSPNGESSCVEGVTCDTYTLTLNGNASDYAGKLVNVKINWLSPTTDYDLFIHKGTNADPVIASSAQGTTTFEAANINPADTGTGVYSVHVVYFAATAADQYSGTASVIAGPPPPPPPSGETPPQYINYQSPPTLGNRAGEPSIGVNWLTGNVMFQAILQTLRVTFNDTTSPATAVWEDKSAPNTNKESFDPIMFTDSRQGRTLVAQLIPGLDKFANLSAFTTNDGRTYTVSQGAGINSGVDHQTIGGGPFKRCTAAEQLSDPARCAVLASRGPITAYPNAVYYASQDIGTAEAALSRDGGRTFGLAVPMYTITDCSGLHGHIKVAPDGTVYVPNKGCSPLIGGNPAQGVQAAVVSENNGLTWEVRRVPNTARGNSDPSIGIGAGGRVFFGYTDGNNHPRIAVSDDRGNTWHDDQDVGTVFGIKNSVFPAVVAGDNDRASFFFLGTSAEGDATGDDSGKPFAGTWYGYVATTYNGGQSWVTVRATDPVQQGVVCTNGTTCPSGTRNLLDFNDMTVDKQGRILAGYADGCITPRCVATNGGTRNENDKASKATIIRQSGGKRLFAAFDPPTP